ncbi:MAG TPA: ABC transporter substrate-binding protein [Candidatus Binatia bacterium]
MKNSLKPRVAWLVGIVCLAFAAAAAAGPPTDQTRQTVDRVLTIVRSPELKAPARQQERRDQLRQAIYARFDFMEMAKRSLGPHWARRSPQEQQEFVKVFTDLLENAYLDKIEGYQGEKIVYTREKLDGDNAEVDSKVVTQKGEEFSINYKLASAGGEWKVYDVVVEDISLVNNYRSQFNRILANASFDELLRKLHQKSPDLKSPAAKG